MLRPGGVLVQASSSAGFVELYLAMREVVPQQRPGIGFDERWTFLLDEGWTSAGDALRHTFTVARQPQRFIDSVEARSSSMTWDLSDEELARALAAAKSKAEELWGDPAQQVAVEGVFKVRAYRPPEG